MVPPIALPVILLALWRVPNDTPRTNVPPDYAGGLLPAGAIGLLVLTLLRIPSSQAWLLLAGCVCLTFLLLQRQRRARYPMLPLWILRNRAFAGPNGVTLLLYWALNGAWRISLLTAVAVSTFATTLAHRLDHAGVPATLHEELMSQAPQLAEVSLPADAGLATPGLRSLIARQATFLPSDSSCCCAQQRRLRPRHWLG